MKKNAKEVIDAAVKNGATIQQLALAACAVGRLCLPQTDGSPEYPTPVGGAAAKAAIETIEEWARGEATAEQVKDARNKLRDVWENEYAPEYASITRAYYAVDYVAVFPDSLDVPYPGALLQMGVISYAEIAGISQDEIVATLQKHLDFLSSPKVAAGAVHYEIGSRISYTIPLTNITLTGTVTGKAFEHIVTGYIVTLDAPIPDTFADGKYKGWTTVVIPQFTC